VYFGVVDNRTGSKSYLSDVNRKQILVPPKFANAHLVLSKVAAFHYQMAFEGKYNDIDK